jgi:hypothetical protein
MILIPDGKTLELSPAAKGDSSNRVGWDEKK